MKTNLFLITLFICFFAFAQTTAIPDINFENYLETHDATGAVVAVGAPSSMGNGIANDHLVTTANINTVTTLNVSSLNISDLTGISDFTALTSLDCKLNNLGSLDVTSNLNLVTLNCKNNALTFLDVSTNYNLLYLYCQNNFLNTLDVYTNVHLIRLYCFNNEIASLNITSNIDLVYLYCHKNKLTSLVTNHNIHLQRINCSWNQIGALDLSNNPNLVRLYCYRNLLTNLDVSVSTSLNYLRCQNNSISNLVLNPSALIELNCSSNQLTTIDVSGHINLLRIYLQVNQFTTIDVSANINLQRFYCHTNQLNRLDIRNGNNTNISSSFFNSYNNPNLFCIEVDDTAYATANWTNIDPVSSFSTNCYTYVPDNNFETYLETHNASGAVVAMGDPTSMGNGVMDNYVFTDRIYTVSILQVSGLSIADLTGIEDFTALVLLDCSNNQITTLDFTSNTVLAQLSCQDNLLTTLNITSNTALTNVTCFNNQLTTLDLTNKTSLLVLWCFNNQITSLNTNDNINMYALLCRQNLLTSLDLTNNILLDDLRCNNNQITSLDLSLLTVLTNVNTSNNSSLTSLNLKNGNNTNIAYYNSTNTPNLTCIEVDDVAYSTTSWTNVDPASTFSLHCPLGETYVPDNNFETYLETHDASGTVVPMGDPISMGNGIMDDYVTTANINTVTSLSVQNLSIVDMTGIEDFTQLTYLTCYQNQITSLDVSNNLLLQTLLCNVNQISSLDLSQNTVLQSLWCFGNQLTSLDLSLNVNMAQLLCDHNQISTLDLSMNTALTQLRCHNNNMTDLNVKNGNNTNFTTFQSDNNPNLLCIEVDDVAYSTANWTNIDPASAFSTHCPLGETYVPDNNFETYLETHNASGTVVPMGDPTSMGNGVMDDYVATANIDTVIVLNIISKGIADLTGIEDFLLLEELYVGNNILTTVNLSNNTALKKLEIYQNQLTTIDVSALNLLEVFHIASNNLTAIDVSNNPNLALFRCQANSISTVDVSNNPFIYQLYVNNNNLSSLDVSQNPILNQLLCYNNNLTSLNVKNGNNTNFISFDSTSNPNLLCIEVDSPIYSDTNWTNIDPASSFSNDCPSLCSYPSDLFAIPTVSDVTLSWTENGFATVWDLKIGLQGFNPSFMPPTNENVTNPFVWTGGLPNTSYDFYVRADCSGTNTVTSQWIGPYTFTVPANTNCEQEFVLDTSTPFNGVMNSSIAFSDVDGDSDQDILITGLTTSNQKIAELYVNNSGVFTLQAGTPFVGVFESKVAFADVDNDNDDDVLIYGKDTSGNWVTKLYLNNGVGIFSIDITNTFATYSYASLDFADVDGNGYKDLLICGYGGSSLYKNNAGVFTIDGTTNFEILGKSATDFADIDGDGDMDVLISGINLSNQYKSNLYKNNGTGTFVLDTSSALQGVFRGDNEFADIDNDGDLDLLITGYNAGTYYAKLYRNNGSGVFTLISGTPFNGIFASSIEFSDYDNDGDADVLITGQAGSRISKLYNNDGSGVFTEVLGTPFDGIDSGDVAFSDVDMDGDKDVLITGQNVGGTRIAKLYLNNIIFDTKYTATGWTNGIPNLNKCAIIDQDYTTVSFSSYKTTVNASKTLTVAANTFMEVKKDIINDGAIIIEPTGSVVQIEDTSTVTGTGVFNTKINSTSLQDRYRFTYFSSPSASATLNVFSSWADMAYLWEFNETIQDWDYISNIATPMDAGNGYILRGSASFFYPFVGSTVFNGAYNNGIVTRSLHFKGDGSLTANLDNDGNLVGNPYPSAIDGVKLLNSTLNPTAGTLYFWTHNTGLVGGSFSSDDYAMWNLSGGTVAITGGTAPTGFVASGQGFFIDAEGDETIPLGQEVISTLTFNNDMRVTANNTDFRRPSNTNKKIWINLTNNDGLFNQALIAFIPNTTLAFDRAYDGKRNPNGIANIYSMDTGNQHLGIQALPVLQDETIIPLGYEVEDNTIQNLLISIDHTENMEDYTIYLKDNLLNTIYDLTNSNYQINVSDAGVFDNRFELIFRNAALDVKDYLLDEDLIVSNLTNTIMVKTVNGSDIKKLEIYDTLGKLIFQTNEQNSQIRIPTQNINQGTVLFIKAKLANDTILNKKIIKL